MKKLTKKDFLKIIDLQENNILEDNIIPSISSSKIIEFRVGKSFVYKIADNKALINIQESLNKNFLYHISLNNCVTSFRKNYSYLDFFEPHRKNYHFIRLDIKNFFYSITRELIKEEFSEYFQKGVYIDDEMTQTLLDAFLNLVTYTIPDNSLNVIFKNKDILPIGFLSSPMISNIIFRRLDLQIQHFCSLRNIVYTRYADDMLFSTQRNFDYIHSENFLNEIRILLFQMNFKLNTEKTLKAKHTLSLNGYTIQYSSYQDDFIKIMKEEEGILIHEFRISNKKIDIIKKLIYLKKKKKSTPKVILKKLFQYELSTGIPAQKIDRYYDIQLLNKITGYRSYLISILLFNKRYQCTQDKTINKYKEIIEDLNSLIK